MEKIIGRDTRRPRRKNKTQTLRSRSRANGLLIPANNWDVSKMGGMSEEIDTAGGGEGREKKNKMGVFACTGFQLTMRTIPLPPRCCPPPSPFPHPPPSCGLLHVSRPINLGRVRGATPRALLRLRATDANEDSIICSSPPPLLLLLEPSEGRNVQLAAHHRKSTREEIYALLRRPVQYKHHKRSVGYQ